MFLPPVNLQHFPCLTYHPLALLSRRDLRLFATCWSHSTGDPWQRARHQARLTGLKQRRGTLRMSPVDTRLNKQLQHPAMPMYSKFIGERSLVPVPAVCLRFYSQRAGETMKCLTTTEFSFSQHWSS